MIGKQIIGTSFRSVLNYNEEKLQQGKGEKIGGNMFGVDSRSLAKEFGMIRALKPNVSKAVYHTSISISPDEDLSNEKFRELGEKYLERMGFDNSQFLIYRHTDTEHPHIHLIANRIDLDGKVVSDSGNYKRSEKIIRELEKEYALKEVVSSEKVEEKAYSKGQYENFRKTGAIPIKVQLQVIVKKAIKESRSVKEFENRIIRGGATVKFHRNSNDKIYGVSFQMEGVKFKASQLGRGYSWNKIKEQLYDEQNQRIGSEESGRKGSYTRGASQKNTRNQPTGYQGTEDQINSSSKGSEGVDNRGQERDSHIESTAKSTDRYSGTGGQAATSNDLYSNENGTEVTGNESEGVSGGNTSGIINGLNMLFGGSAGRLEGQPLDDDKPKKKKKKRKRSV
ncbi:relaxase/mobilization nuclease domain-containing protein [Marinifilum caeruleilacunae]|uniref:MobA/VirD2-like nuclease domain-containing protein n=1 Tax=Marinifilum caeruleilacunae TaxID=2499076 RepID=A0ABX1WWZ4_9BACT|nr:relaxase/mobilization nuclease domain-containing protein [Marinifilum caeruleilacunae]NOU60572.1 hypothetical protein [Marinifilum caeruleilacunae]